MMFSSCDLFKRSFSNKGIGFTFNNENGETLYKDSSNLGLLMKVFKTNDKIKVQNMKSAGSQHSLKVLIENSAEEIERYENTKKSFR